MDCRGSRTQRDDVTPAESGVLRPCPICTSRRITVLHHQEFATPRELKAPSAYDVVACERCGFVYANQEVGQSALDCDYETHSKYVLNTTDAKAAKPLTSGSFPDDPPWDLERLSGVAAYLSEHMPNKALRILDAGCANGSFLGYMKDNGFENIVGLDPSPAAVANARARYGVEAVAGSFVRRPKTLGDFDLIALSHTLEHITDVSGAVLSLKALLRPNGMAYIEVPDASRFAAYLVAPFHDFNTEHINHFSLRTLRTLMKVHGFEEVDAGLRTVRNSPIDDYPVVFGLWRSSQLVESCKDIASVPIERDDDLVTAIRQYVRGSRVLMQQIDERLRMDLAGHDDVIIWGAGQLTMKLLRDTVLREKRIAAIVDSSAQRQGMHIDSTSILAPSALRDLPPYPLIIGSLHSETSIAATIRDELSLKNLVIRLLRPEQRPAP